MNRGVSRCCSWATTGIMSHWNVVGMSLRSWASRGIDLVYTDDLNDLNRPTLDRYDVLLLYANWLKISPEQEKALLDYVESGHGFAPIHCGSYCFLNSPKITALIGGAIQEPYDGRF